MQNLITGLDHVLVHSTDFDRDLAAYTVLLGTESPGVQGADDARVAVFDAGNTHLVLQENLLEAPGMAGLCFRVGNRERLLRRLQRLDLATEDAAAADPVAQAFAGETAGAGLIWLAKEAARGLHLGFAERVTADRATPPRRITGLDHAVIASCDAPGTAFLLGARLGLDLRMDMSRPEWNARLMFFRCGDLILEVYERLDSESGGAGDEFYGLSWRVADAPRANADLQAEGFDVSPLRRGRKPGTEVFTVRDRTAGVATLMLGKTG